MNDGDTLQQAHSCSADLSIIPDQVPQTRRARPFTRMPLPESFLQDNNADERALPRLQISPPDVGLGSVFVLEESRKKDKEEQQKVGSTQVSA